VISPPDGNMQEYLDTLDRLTLRSCSSTSVHELARLMAPVAVLVTALFMVAACGGGGGSGTPSDSAVSNASSPGTTSAAPATVTELWVQTARFKASSPGSFNQFGGWIRVSGDGGTLAITSTGDSSVATTINGDQSQTSSFNQSGAVSVFVRDRQGQWLQQAYLKSARRDDRLGTDVALSRDGNTLVVGAAYAQGEAIDFGVLGGPTFGSGAGRVLIFKRDSTATWSESATLLISDGRVSDRFGGALALTPDGRTLIAGATGRSYGDVLTLDDFKNPLVSSGAAYVFNQSTDGRWSQVARLRAPAPRAHDWFGHDVDISADGATIAISALHDSASGPNLTVSSTPSSENAFLAGAVHIFARQSDGRYRHNKYLKPPVLANYLHFGQSIALSADGLSLAVGADFGGWADAQALATLYNIPIPTTAIGLITGSVFMFSQSAQGWQFASQISPSNVGQLDRRFGFDVSLSADGKRLAVGMIDDNRIAMDVLGGASIFQSGSAQLFTKTSDVWQAASRFKANPTMAQSKFGNSVSLSSDGQRLVAAAARESSSGRGINPSDDQVLRAESGAAYLFDLQP
jgi:trimeric autotransporter adhesin